MNELKKIAELVGYNDIIEVNDLIYVYGLDDKINFAQYDPKNNPGHALDLIKYIIKIPHCSIEHLVNPEAYRIHIYNIATHKLGADAENSILEDCSLDFIKKYIENES